MCWSCALVAYLEAKENLAEQNQQAWEETKWIQIDCLNLHRSASPCLGSETFDWESKGWKCHWRGWGGQESRVDRRTAVCSEDQLGLELVSEWH